MKPEYPISEANSRKQGWLFLLVLIALTISACANTNVQSMNEDMDSLPDQSELSGDLLYDLLVGEFAGNSGDMALSVESYNRAAMKTPDARVAARATYIAVYGERYQDALDLLERWERLDPDDVDVPRMYAITYLKLGQPLEAAAYIQSILDTVEGNGHEKALAVKRLLAKESNTADGLVVLDALTKADTSNQHMLILQARYAAQLERYDEALVLLDRVLEIDPTLADVHIIKARILAAQGKQEQAMGLIAMVLMEQPENDHLRLQYARMLVEQRQFNQAKAQFNLLLKNDPENAEILLSLGLLNIETGELDQAADHLTHLVNIGQKANIANYYLGRIAQNREQHKIAISYYLKVNSGDYVFDAKMRIAGLFARLGRVDEGLRQLEVLAENQTTWALRVRAYLAQGEILASKQRYAEGLEMYSRALQQKPDDADLLYARALMAEKVDRIDITEADLLKLLSAQPENANALNALGYTLADRTERLEEARDYIKRAAELVPDDPAILDSLGWVSYRLGNMQDALKWLGMAFERLEDAEIAAHYGEVLWKNNRKEEAEKVWQIGLENNAEHPVLLETMKRLKD
ncbi:MAG: tetratricopeptide repeat protein [Thiotrichales bacterium]|nr:MAG: tetratricopeptide repeat protein [Thiotrichales bacterium]